MHVLALQPPRRTSVSAGTLGVQLQMVGPCSLRSCLTGRGGSECGRGAQEKKIVVVMRQGCAHMRAQVGMAYKIFSEPHFWLELLLVYVIAFSLRYLERSARWLFYPNDNMILARCPPSVFAASSPFWAQ